MKNPENTGFNKLFWQSLTWKEFKDRFEKSFSGDAEDWYYKITGKRKPGRKSPASQDEEE